MKSMKYGLAIACVCASIGLMGCDAVKSLFGHRSTDSSDSYGEDGEGGSRMAPPKGGFVVDDSGTMRMMPPTEIQQREGAAARYCNAIREPYASIRRRRRAKRLISGICTSWEILDFDWRGFDWRGFSGCGFSGRGFSGCRFGGCGFSGRGFR